MNVDQLINSLCRGDDDAATFRRIEVDPGESLADEAAQSGVIDIRPFRKAEEALFHKFGLKPRVIPRYNHAVGIGGKAKVLGKVEMRSGMGRVNGIVKCTVVDSPAVPPLTPASLLKQVGAVIDLNSNTMDLKKIETTTTLRAVRSGHVANKLTEFAPGGWKSPTPEQTELLQVRTDVFRPVPLPGEFKSRSSKQCAGFSSGFVNPVRDRSHLSPSHHQHGPDLCVHDTVSSDLFSDDQLARGTSNFECSFASGFDVDANSAMEKLCVGRRGSVAKTCSAVPGSRHPSVVADRAGLVATSLLKNHSNRVRTFARTPGPSRQPVGLNGCVRQETREMRRHHELLPLSCIDRSQRGKGQDERKKERYHHDQPKSRTDCRGCLFQGERGRCLSEIRPRTVRSVATFPSTVSASSISTAARGVVGNGSLASASRGRRIHWGPVEYGHGN